MDSLLRMRSGVISFAIFLCLREVTIGMLMVILGGVWVRGYVGNGWWDVVVLIIKGLLWWRWCWL